MNPEIQKLFESPIESQKVLACHDNYQVQLIRVDQCQYVVKEGKELSENLHSEAQGLKDLSKFFSGIPNIIKESSSYLVTEFIETEAPKLQFWKNLAYQLTQLHLSQFDDFGYHNNNFIGASEQRNQLSNNWAEFFWNERILFKLKQLQDAGQYKLGSTELAKLKNSYFQILRNHKVRPALVHGDLWRGNVLCGPGQKPYLIDPACYWGDPEVDLAMTECFGGFDQAFYRFYDEYQSIQPGYEERKHIYNLYHLLNHFVIFGTSYQSSVENVIERLIY